MTKPVTITVHVKTLSPAQKRALAVDKRRLNYEIGRLVQAWAHLHEQLAGIFEQATECPPHIAQSIWHSIKSDLTQREMLLSALKARLELLEHIDSKDGPIKKRAFGEFCWAIQETTKRSVGRNDLVHSPIIFYRHAMDTEYEAQIDRWGGNPRAKKLEGKELYQYCRWLSDFCERMSKHLRSIWPHLRKHGALPDRPQWPLLSQFPTRKQSPRGKARKRPKPQL